MDYNSDDGYAVAIESEQEGGLDSSDDEIEIVLHGTPEQRCKLLMKDGAKSPSGKKSAGNDDSSEDEFEKEMKAELDTVMTTIEQEHKTVVPAGKSTTQSNGNSNMEPDCYDNTYFDSDSDDEGTTEGELHSYLYAEKKSRKRPVLSNDDLLYDPTADDADQMWVDAQRRRYQPSKSILKRKHPMVPPKPRSQERLPNSDAILNCPACMVQLCLDCQRHEKYNNQYRTMFVMNCTVNYEQRLKFPKQHRKKKRNMESMEAVNVPDPDDDSYHPVKCSQCTTEVGVYDTDEVFHFFNVLASYS